MSENTVIPNTTNEKFDFTGSLKKKLFYMMGIGVLGIAMLLLFYPDNHHARFWSNILANTYFFTGIGLFGLFVVAAAQIAYGGWQTLEKRILISLSGFARFGGFMLLIILLLGVYGVHSLYEPINHIIQAKKPISHVYNNKLIYFSTGFWAGRVFVYALLWCAFSLAMDKFFARVDQTNPKVYKRSKLLCAAFVVVFALTESAISWDMIMSLDIGWYSTLFGWYNFASYGCAAWAMTILLVIFLKSKGYLARINENHVHDLGKMLFVFSIFWTYLWFDQFMLQWYANIPDETNFWVKRFDTNYFTFTIFLALTINFAFPLLFLIKRSAKRNFRIIGFGAALLIFGHYMDFFNFTFVEANWNKAAIAKEKEERKEALSKTQNVVFYAEANTEKKETATDAVPAKENSSAMSTEVKKTEEKKVEGKEGEEEAKPEKNYAGIGVAEILTFIGFLGVFLYLFFLNLAKRPIIPEDDPYLKEAEKLVVTYA